MSDWRYYACDLGTGRLRTQLPLTPSGAMTRELSGVGTGTFTLPLTDPSCPDDWDTSTIPQRTQIVAEMNGQIVWSGIIGARKRDQTDVVELNCSTVESYFGKRYIDYDVGPYSSTDQNYIMFMLVNHAMHTSGIALTFDELDLTTGVFRDRTEYARERDQRVLDMMDDLASVEGGPEWTLLTRWAADTEVRRVENVMKIETPHIGHVVDNPEWVFECPGNIVEWEVFEDFSDDHYANVVVAGGEGEGDDRIMSTNGIAQDTQALEYGQPLMEYRYATQLTTEEAANESALGQLERVKYGTVTAKIKVRSDNYPLHTGWALGDTCRLKLSGGGYPDGYDRLWRIVGWNVDPVSETIEPILNQWGEQVYV